MIEITKEMRQQSDKEKQKLIEEIDEKIKRSFELGRSEAVLPISKDSQFYNEIKKEYEEHGYTIRTEVSYNIRGVVVKELISW